MLDSLTYVVEKAEKEGASEAEAFYSKRNELQVRAENKQVKIGEWKSDAGIGIRLAIKREDGFSLGFAYSTDFSHSALNEAVKQALKVGKTRETDPDFKGFCHKETAKSLTEVYDKKISEISPEEAIALVSSQIDASLNDKRVETVRGLTFLLTTETAVCNSNGVSGSYKTSGFYSSLYVLAKEANTQGAWQDDYASSYYPKEEPIRMAEDTAKLAIQQLHPKPIESGKIDLVMAPDALAELFIYTLILELRADRVQKLQSPFVGKLNKKVGSELLTILNDAHVPKAMGSKLFDDEGVPTKKLPLIEKGVLKSFLYDTYTARKDNVESSGNALRYALLQVVPKYRMEPSIGPTNFVVSPGKASEEAIIEDVKNGIYTKYFIGAHTSNVESGVFSIMPYCAFKIEKGEMKYPIKEAMVGGDILSLLKNVGAIANNVKQVLFYNASLVKDATLIAPSILVKDVSVSA
ncbi:MAG: TldD/PmbA family protein [Candidatus Bathyarchaeia archaeon]